MLSTGTVRFQSIDNAFCTMGRTDLAMPCLARIGQNAEPDWIVRLQGRTVSDRNTQNQQ